LKDQGEKHAWHFSSIAIDKQGIVWCNNLGKGLFNYNPKTHAIKNYRYSKDDSTSLSSDLTSAVLEDHTGLLWIGTLGGGVCSFDPKTNNFRRYPFIKNERNTPNHSALDDEFVFYIYEDKQGTIWVGTNLGGSTDLTGKQVLLRPTKIRYPVS
jgi:streptogramin lyase